MDCIFRANFKYGVEHLQFFHFCKSLPKFLSQCTQWVKRDVRVRYVRIIALKRMKKLKTKKIQKKKERKKEKPCGRWWWWWWKETCNERKLKGNDICWLIMEDVVFCFVLFCFYFCFCFLTSDFVQDGLEFIFSCKRCLWFEKKKDISMVTFFFFFFFWLNLKVRILLFIHWCCLTPC